MKRIISVILLVTVLCLGLAVSVYAVDPAFTVSEDYQTITLNGNVYIRTNTNVLEAYSTYDLAKEPMLTSAQKAELGDCRFYIDDTGNYLNAEFYFRDGSCLNINYATEILRQTLEEVRSNNDLELVVEFEWPDENRVYTTVNDLMGKPTVLSEQTLSWSRQYTAYRCLQEEELYVKRGYVLEENGRFYYVDIHENSLDYYPYWDPMDSEPVNAYIVTDPELLSQLGDALDARNGVNEFFEDDSFAGLLSAVVMTILFGVLPAGIFALALTLSIRSNGYYRLIWAITAGLAAAVMLTYIGFVLLILAI